MAMVEEIEIVIVGGGICGLATSLALYRKGIKSVVLERSETLRATGAAITIFANGWRALHQLGLDSKLRSTSILIERFLEIDLDNKDELRETPISDGEARCLKRIDLVEALANELPPGTIRFGCQVVSIDVESSSSSPILMLHNGSLIKAKVLIGCDGANSGVANFVGLKPIQPFLRSAVRGVTTYPSGHGFTPAFLRLKKDQCLVGRIPMNETSVYWFVFIQENEKDVKMSKDPESIKQVALDSTVDFSTDVVEMINNSDLNSLSLTKLTCRAPWDLLRGTFRREAATVAGDAWHVMGPFAGQGGSAALEDAIELARCLSKRISREDVDGVVLSERKAREALDEYIKSRRVRILYLSTLTYIRGLLSVGNPSLLVTFLCIAIMRVVFRDPMKHTRYDCGEL